MKNQKEFYIYEKHKIEFIDGFWVVFKKRLWWWVKICHWRTLVEAYVDVDLRSKNENKTI